MRMLVRIEMRDRDSSGLDLADLCGGLGFNLFGIQAARNCACSKSLQPITKNLSGVSVCKGRNLIGPKDSVAVDQNHMTTDTHAGNRLCKLCGLGESRAVGHQC